VSLSAVELGAAGGWALLAGVLAPGWLAARSAGLGRGALEQLVVAVALGRIALAGLGLVTASAGLLAALPVLAGLALVAALWLGRRGLHRPTGSLLPALAAPTLLVLFAAWVVQGVAGRSGLETAAGELVFFGRHTTNDPLVYTAIARRIATVGWPVGNPFVAGLPNLGHALWFGWIEGLQAVSGADWLDVTFRLRPHIDVASLALTAFALARALGAGVRGSALGAILLLMGGGLSQPLFWGLRAVGVPVNLMELWAADTGFLLAFNPIAPALQTGFAALLLLARAGPGDRASAIAAGLLVAAVFELKVFLWPSLLGGLLLAAAWRPPRFSAPALRRAALVAGLASLPLLLHTAAFTLGLGATVEVGFWPCPACLPRFALDSALGDPFVMRRSFEPVGAAELASPVWWATALAATSVWLAVAAGARFAALPALWRGSSGDAPEPAAPGAAGVMRVIAGAAILGIGAACLLATPPHYLNVVQFAWSGLFGLWVVLAVELEAWLVRDRRWRVLAVFGLALPTGLFWLLDQGWAAPAHERTSLDERLLMARLAELSDPDALVLEPSLLVSPGRPTPVAWLAGRQAYLSKSGMAEYLPEAERSARTARLEAVFATADRTRALAALRETGAEWLYAPEARPLGFDPRPELVLEHVNPAGSLWRVRRASESGPARLRSPAPVD